MYPPIARAAHVSGTVVLVATFDTTGGVTEVRSVSGPVMLRASAETFVKGWKANPYTGPRSCPVVVEFRVVGEPHVCGKPAPAGQMPAAGRLDPQHYRVVVEAGCVVMQSATSAN